MTNEPTTNEFIEAININRVEIVLTINGKTLDYGSELSDRLEQLQKKIDIKDARLIIFESDQYIKFKLITAKLDLMKKENKTWELRNDGLRADLVKENTSIEKLCRETLDLTAQLDQALENKNKWRQMARSLFQQRYRTRKILNNKHWDSEVIVDEALAALERKS